MNTVTVKNVTIGGGIPKICAPIVANTKEEVLADALDIVNSWIDIIEWHVDWFGGALDIEKMKDVLEQLSSVPNQISLLFTLHIAREGGRIDLSSEAYLEIDQAAAAADRVDLIDVGVLDKEIIAAKVIESTHTAGVRVVGSNHQFDRTPSQEEMVDRLRKIQELGADVCKIAIMPQDETDIIRLLEATSIMRQKYAKKPFVTVPMAKPGVVSRITNEMFGSALTSGTVEKASTSRQIKSEMLYQVLQDVHEVL